MPDFRAFLDSIARRPGIYVGRASIRDVGHCLQGYDQAAQDLGSIPSPLEGWGWWLESRYLICHAGWHWTRILAHAFGDDGTAIRALPELYDEFIADRARVGVAELENERERRMIAAYGQDWHEPETTHTSVEG